MAFEALQEAVKSGRRELVLLQLNETPEAVKGADCNGTTAAILAARLNKEEILKEIIGHGGDPHAAELPEIGANTALHFAARNKNDSEKWSLVFFPSVHRQINKTL